MTQLNGNEGSGLIRPPRKCKTAFLVVVDEDGAAVAVPDINLPLELERPPTLNDMVRGCTEVERDIASSQTAQRVLQMIGNLQQVQVTAAQVGRLGDLRRGQ